MNKFKELAKVVVVQNKFKAHYVKNAWTAIIIITRVWLNWIQTIY